MKETVMTDTDTTGTRSFIRAYHGLQDWADGNRFAYEIAYPSREHMLDEVYDIIGEVLIDDIYRLSSITRTGDLWIDAGCHVGLFSIAAIQAGASVALCVDADSEMAWCARYNTSMFVEQSIARGLASSEDIYPYCAFEKITSVDQLLGFDLRSGYPHYKRKCLKLDIQGAEQNILTESNASKLSDEYDLMVFEYHYDDASEISNVIERDGWMITSITSHRDILLNTDTSIIWAESK